MYKRAEELWGIYWKKTHSKFPVSWDNLDHVMKRGWWEVALAESRLIDQVQNRYSIEEDRLKAEMATMVKRKHYNDAIGSLAGCQSMIESLVREVERMFPNSEVAKDGRIVLGLLEAMISANPDMQTDDWHAREKVQQDKRDAEYRAAVQAKMWEGKDYKP